MVRRESQDLVERPGELDVELQWRDTKIKIGEWFISAMGGIIYSGQQDKEQAVVAFNINIAQHGTACLVVPEGDPAPPIPFRYKDVIESLARGVTLAVAESRFEEVVVKTEWRNGDRSDFLGVSWIYNMPRPTAE